ncbi:hypothetical protein CSKR_111046 [Clonorchis sinensis]|uniref:Uncharacterized protein n=1 Tax=Clonorchis sinensis TaxID=79923 RepID=A0A419QE42_CLOSI|nr:hypothetical protein CSKR_111046 [Clonorchis sinensis]
MRHVWEDQCDAFLTFERDPLAYVVENSLVVESLRRAAMENSDNLTVMYDTQARNIQLPSVDQLDQPVHLEAHVLNSSDPPLLLETSLLVRFGRDGGMARWPKWLEREFTARKVRGSNPTSASRLLLSRLEQPGSIPALVLSSGGMVVRRRKGAIAFVDLSSLTTSK